MENFDIELFREEAEKAGSDFRAFQSLIPEGDDTKAREAFTAYRTEEALRDAAGNVSEVEIAKSYIIDSLIEEVKIVSKQIKALRFIAGKDTAKSFKVEGLPGVIKPLEVDGPLSVLLSRMKEAGKAVCDMERAAVGVGGNIGSINFLTIQKEVGEALKRVEVLDPVEIEI